jgi:PAS domain S-box-containing protein
MRYKSGTDQFQIFESVLHGVIITDLRGHILFMNRSSENMLGYPEDELIGKPLSLLYAEEQEHSFKEILKKWAVEKKLNGRLHAKQKNNGCIWLDVKSSILNNAEGKSEFCVITICDIEKLKFMSSRLKKNQAISQAIFDASIDAMITIDRIGNIRSANRSALDMFGYMQKELIGKNISTLISFPIKSEDNGNLFKYLKNDGEADAVKSKEIDGLKKNGTIFPIELSASKVILEGTSVYAGIIRDLTDSRKLERRILNIGNEERLQIGRELHDVLGQMLTGIRMLSEILYRKLEANALPGAEEVQEISGLVKKADEYTRNLSRNIVHADLKERGLSRAIEDLCKRVSRMTDIQCTFEEEDAIKIEQNDMGQNLYRIAQEAINNAIKHGDPTAITVRLSSDNHGLLLIVDDNGKGFDESRLHQSDQGAGLKIMKHRARVMGGILELSRTEDNCTRVQCIIPNNRHQYV